MVAAGGNSAEELTGGYAAAFIGAAVIAALGGVVASPSPSRGPSEPATQKSNTKPSTPEQTKATEGRSVGSKPALLRFGWFPQVNETCRRPSGSRATY